MNKKGLTDKDILEWIKIAIIVIVGYIIIKAIWSASPEPEVIKCICESGVIRLR